MTSAAIIFLALCSLGLWLTAGSVANEDSNGCLEVLSVLGIVGTFLSAVFLLMRVNP